MGSKCKTCGLTERSHHPCNEAGTLYPCPDEFHREMSIVQCQQPGCTANGLTRARGWWCAIHHPEHPMGPVTPTPPATADDASGAEAMREACAKVCDAAAAWAQAEIDRLYPGTALIDEGHTRLVGKRNTATLLSARIRNLVLPARDDGLEDELAAMRADREKFDLVAEALECEEAYSHARSSNDWMDVLAAAGWDCASNPRRFLNELRRTALRALGPIASPATATTTNPAPAAASGAAKPTPKDP